MQARIRTRGTARPSTAWANVRPPQARPTYRCHICTGIGQVLLCDGCDEEIHMHCCMPPLTKVPEGDFFCTKCEEV